MKLHFRDREQLSRKAKDDAMVAHIRAGGKLTVGEMVYCFFHWSPFKWYVNIVRFIRARKS